MSQLEERQAKRDEDMNQGFFNVFKSLQQLSQDLVESKAASIAQSQSKKKRQKETAPVAKAASKRSAAELLEKAEESEKSSSEEEKLLDSDMDFREHSGDDDSGKSASSEEEDTLDITPARSKVFIPSKEQIALWELYLRRGG